jgi:hypothetical protein
MSVLRGMTTANVLVHPTDSYNLRLAEVGTTNLQLRQLQVPMEALQNGQVLTTGTASGAYTLMQDSAALNLLRLHTSQSGNSTSFSRPVNT